MGRIQRVRFNPCDKVRPASAVALIDWSIQPNPPGQSVQRVQFVRSGPVCQSDQRQRLSVLRPIQRVQELSLVNRCQRLAMLGPIQQVHSDRPHQVGQSSGMNSPWSTSLVNRTLLVNPFNEFSLTDPVHSASQTSVSDSQC